MTGDFLSPHPRIVEFSSFHWQSPSPPPLLLHKVRAITIPLLGTRVVLSSDTIYNDLAPPNMILFTWGFTHGLTVLHWDVRPYIPQKASSGY